MKYIRTLGALALIGALLIVGSGASPVSAQEVAGCSNSQTFTGALSGNGDRDILPNAEFNYPAAGDYWFFDNFNEVSIAGCWSGRLGRISTFVSRSS